MQSLKIHAPVLLSEAAVCFLITQALLVLLQRTQVFESPRSQSHWRAFGFSGSLLGLGISLLLGFHSAMNAIGHQRQLQALVDVLRAGNSGPMQTQAGVPSAQANPQQQQQAANQAKAEFLQKMAAYLEKPETTNIEEARVRLGKDYPGLFEKSGEPIRSEYRNAITSVYQCQKAFFEDVITTLKTKRVEKSAARAKCEATSGAFFLRPLLIPEEQAKVQETTLQALARGESVGEPAITLETARASAAVETKRIEVAKKILN
jgi:hypothetical protein